MEAVLVKVLAPYLPALLGLAKGRVDAAAQRLWRLLRGRVGDGTLAIATAVAHAPGNEALTEQLRLALRQALDADPRLRSDVSRTLQELRIDQHQSARHSGRGDLIQAQGPVMHSSPGGSLYHHSPVDARQFHGDNPWRGAHGAALCFLALGSLVALAGFALFGYSIFRMAGSPPDEQGFPSITAIGFGVFVAGGVVASIGGVLNRNNF